MSLTPVSSSYEDIGGVPSMQSCYSAGMKRCGICMEERSPLWVRRSNWSIWIGTRQQLSKFTEETLAVWSGPRLWVRCEILGEIVARHWQELALRRITWSSQTPACELRRCNVQSSIDYCSEWEGQWDISHFSNFHTSAQAMYKTPPARHLNIEAMHIEAQFSIIVLCMKFHLSQCTICQGVCPFPGSS